MKTTSNQNDWLAVIDSNVFPFTEEDKAFLQLALHQEGRETDGSITYRIPLLAGFACYKIYDQNYEALKEAFVGLYNRSAYQWNDPKSSGFVSWIETLHVNVVALSVIEIGISKKATEKILTRLGRE